MLTGSLFFHDLFPAHCCCSLRFAILPIKPGLCGYSQSELVQMPDGAFFQCLGEHLLATDEELPSGVKRDIAKRFGVEIMTGSNDLPSYKYYPHIHEYSDSLYAIMGRRAYELLAHHAGLDSVTSVRNRQPPLRYGLMPEHASHFIDQAAVTTGAVNGVPAPIEILCGGKLLVIHVCLSIDGLALTPGLCYVPSLGFLGLTEVAFKEIGVDNMNDAMLAIQHMGQDALHELCKKTGAMVRSGNATLCRRSDNACESLVALHLAGNGGGTQALISELKDQLMQLREKCSACLAAGRACVRKCAANCTNYCDSCEPCISCVEENCVCKRLTIDTLSMDCASVQWSTMQADGAAEELGLNVGFVPDNGHVARRETKFTAFDIAILARDMARVELSDPGESPLREVRAVQ